MLVLVGMGVDVGVSVSVGVGVGVGGHWGVQICACLEEGLLDMKVLISKRRALDARGYTIRGCMLRGEMNGLLQKAFDFFASRGCGIV